MVVRLRYAELRGHLRPGEPHGLADDDLGDLREVITHAHQRNLSREVGHGHPEDRCALELPQHFHLPIGFILGEIREPRGHFGFELGAWRRQPAGRFVQQFVQQQRMRGYLRSEELTARGELHQFAPHRPDFR